MKGKRASYFHPLRMYLFTSALFFLLFSAVFIKGLLPGNMDMPVHAPNATAAPDPVLVDYSSVYQYDSLQLTLQESQRDGWVRKQLTHKIIELNQKYQKGEVYLIRDTLQKIIHYFPYLLFVSLPLYALYLKLLYRRQKAYYYNDHAIFLVHLYIFTFLLLLLIILLHMLNQYLGTGFMVWVYTLLIGYGVVYAYLSMLRFYGERKVATLLKFLLFNSMAVVSLFILFFLFLLVVTLQL